MSGGVPPAPAPAPVKEWRRRLGDLRRQGSFTRNLATVMTGTTVAQVMGVAAAPLLTRLYDPADMGAFGFYLAVVSTLAVAACGRYDQAVVLPARDEEAASLLVLSLWLSLGTGLLLLAVMLLAGGPILERAGVPDSWALRLLLPAGIATTAAFVALNAWAQRRKDFRGVAGSRMAQAAGTAGAQVGLGFVAGTGGLPGGHVLGAVVGGARLGWRTWREDGPLLRAHGSVAAMKTQAAAHADFPRYAAPLGMMNTLSQQIPALLLPALFAPAVLGQYVLSYRVFSLPLSVVGQAFQQVFYQRAAEQHVRGLPLRPLLVKSYLGLLAISVPPAILLMAVAPPLFARVFGPEWRVAGEYTRLLLPWLALKFATSPATSLFAILGRQRLLFWSEIITFALRLAALLVGGLVMHSATWAIGLFGAAGLLVNLGYAYRLVGLAGAADRAAAAARSA
ncbi:MAG TPA: lipopolysaccharide biosynthesis protein [Longimicrobium sp.]|nr:lipopolysaccharide biosynthesis protein [Longimicrobium sp.]